MPRRASSASCPGRRRGRWSSRCRCAAIPFRRRACRPCRRYFRRVPRCMIATMWSVRPQAHHRLDVRIVGRRSRLPHDAVTQIVRRQEQILRGGARRDHLLDLGHLGMLAHRAADDDERRASAAFCRARQQAAPRSSRAAGAAWPPRPPREPLRASPSQHHQLPWLHAPVIGRALRGRQDAREMLGGRPGSTKRAAEERVSMAVSKSISFLESCRNSAGYGAHNRL